MRQFQNFGDQRNHGFCVHCGGSDATRDHVPSKVMLDRPLPPNLPVAPACLACNNGFSADEEYLACLIECVIHGTTESARLSRASIGRALEQNAALRRSIESGRRETASGLVWVVDNTRVRRVLLKLARGHVAYELNEPRLDEAKHIWFGPLAAMSRAERERFEQDDWDLSGWPEVGSRATQRVLILEDASFQEPWLVVQDSRYRYRVDQSDGSRVRIVISEYLACEIIWD